MEPRLPEITASNAQKPHLTRLVQSSMSFYPCTDCHMLCMRKKGLAKVANLSGLVKDSVSMKGRLLTYPNKLHTVPLAD